MPSHRMAKVCIYEIRKLVLPLETAVDAILELDREHGGLLARATLIEARIERGSEAGITLVVRRAGSPANERRKFTLAAIAAAFINYCWKSRIPLPRNGTKRIDVVPEGFAITIEGSVEIIRRHSAVPETADAEGEQTAAEGEEGAEASVAESEAAGSTADGVATETEATTASS